MVSARVAVTTIAVAAIVGACNGRSSRQPTTDAVGINKIQHVVIVMQENRSFDHYFGTYPGADGFPRDAQGQFTTCLPDPASSQCARPYHDSADINTGADHDETAAYGVLNGGKMDGFVKVGRTSTHFCQAVPELPACKDTTVVDVMGYHDAREIPNYWRYAQEYALQDHMFEPVLSWSLVSHLYMVSAWSAVCGTSDPFSCENTISPPFAISEIAAAVGSARKNGTSEIEWAWTDLTHLLRTHGVSWGYYIETGLQPDCTNDKASCPPVPLSARTPGVFNPLPLFGSVQEAGDFDKIQDVDQFRKAARKGTLPAVSWIVPSDEHSEHPPAGVHQGQAWVTGLVNEVMKGPNWDSTAIFVSWDDWGGFYDHVLPPKVDANGYGLRVPGLVISPYAKRGFVDHQILSHDAYIKFIEDRFLKGDRLDPATDGRPDPRISVREDASVLGDISAAFDFTQKPRKPLILPTNPKPGPGSTP